MGNKMLIDATHPEETRVVVFRGHRVEEFDYESASRKQLRGNIYLAKVTRVEPSLQAAFVNYGGNRHGFLAFNEIHPDYYQLPMAERQALKQEEARLSRRGSYDGDEVEPAADYAEDGNDQQDQELGFDGRNADHDDADQDFERQADLTQNLDDEKEEEDRKNQTTALEAALPPTIFSAKTTKLNATETKEARDSGTDEEPADSKATETTENTYEIADNAQTDRPDHTHHRDNATGRGDENDQTDAEEGSDDDVESVGSEDALEELPQRNRRRRRSYKIQEVIKRGQILLVQVVKEERGNKGAALTTYLSLAGRYTVLMPNTASGGGISRKISSPSDRKRLREIAGELDVPEGMGLIIRTAGASRTKTEVKRDYEYLLRLWENVRDLTLKSTAPCLVYEEGDLIKRSIRDLYSREIDEVLVAGDGAYRDAKDFMRMLMPSHAKNVQPYKEPEPLFTRFEVERQLNAMFSPQVTLPSGGYIIINQTEALVAVDVNSGKSTREYSIEDTALKTNLEAAEEISRQLRLRDLAGLIVVDFIDMEEKRNNRAVERKLKECLRSDRARIQVGRISHFGLLEMSRQRIRTGMVEGSTIPCAHCHGTGFVRSTESVALSVLRSLEDWLRTNSPCDLNAVASNEAALYILNHKRSYLRDIETRHGVVVSVSSSERMHGANFYIEKVSTASVSGAVSAPITQSDRIIQPFESEGREVTEDQERRSRRRRRRRPRRTEDDQRTPGAPMQSSADEKAGENDVSGEDRGTTSAYSDADDGEDKTKNRRRSRRRGRRGGRQQRTARSSDAALRDENASTVQKSEQPSIEEDAPWFDEEPGKAEDRKSETMIEEGPASQNEMSIRDDRSSFRSQPRRKTEHSANGSGKPNGHYQKELGNNQSNPENVDAGDTAEAAVDEAPVPPKPKPRGTRRGWWQRREA